MRIDKLDNREQHAALECFKAKAQARATAKRKGSAATRVFMIRQV